eukprot:2105189-Lingulodinium_polyedra.AAC.1
MPRLKVERSFCLESAWSPRPRRGLRTGPRRAPCCRPWRPSCAATRLHCSRRTAWDARRRTVHGESTSR